MKTIEKIKKEYDLSLSRIAEVFGYKSRASFTSAARRKQIEDAICELEQIFSKK